jgi:hypothetical protein
MVGKWQMVSPKNSKKDIQHSRHVKKDRQRESMTQMTSAQKLEIQVFAELVLLVVLYVVVTDDEEVNAKFNFLVVAIGC